MKKILFICIMLVTGGVLLAGSVVEEKRQVPAFDKIELRGVGTLQIVQGSETSVTVRADESVQKLLRTEVVESELRLWKEPLPVVIVPSDSVTWIVTVKDLKSLSVSGSGKVKADQINTPELRISIAGSGKISFGSINAENLLLQSSGSAFFESERLQAQNVKCDISGSGTVRISAVEVKRIETCISGGGDILLRGIASESTVDMSGSARYNALDLESDRVRVANSGSGRAAVNSKGDLEIKSTGSGVIFYRGRPRITQKISGSTEIKQVD